MLRIRERVRAVVAIAEARELSMPESFDELIQVGYFATLQGDFVTAADCYAEAVSLSPANSLMWFRYGEALLAAGEGEAARNALQKASDLLPGHMPTRMALAKAFTANGAVAEALVQLDTILLEQPKNPGVNLLKLRLLCRAERWQEAGAFVSKQGGYLVGKEAAQLKSEIAPRLSPV